jgi:hypothetical protein
VRISLITILVLHATAASAGWRSIVKDSLQAPLVRVPHVSALRGDKETIVQLKNTNQTTLKYSGHGKETPTTYWEEFQQGRWVQTRWPWCGTGLEDYSLPPGGTVTFRISDEELGRGARIYTIIRSADGTRGSLILLYERKPRPTKRSTE